MTEPRIVAAVRQGATPSAASERRALRVLTFTSLFPSSARPRHGIFVEARLSQLKRYCDVDIRVIAPVPWFPFTSTTFGDYARLAATPRHATRDSGLDVSYPRYLMLPKVGVRFQPDSMARTAMFDVEALERQGWQPDIIDAHYLYPDGVAAAVLAARLNLPFMMTARGTDVNVLAKMPGPGRRIAAAAEAAVCVATVSESLRASLASLGFPESKLTVLRNGVDLQIFGIEDPAESRDRLGLPEHGRLLASIGNLVPEKDQALAIATLPLLEGCSLVIVGDGRLRGDLAALSRELGVEDRVIFRTAMPQHELRYLYAAADVLLLTSTREGWPNVVLEAIACGTPVVAMNVGAVAEMLKTDQVGCIVNERTPRALAQAVVDMLAVPSSREALRQHAAQFDWQSIAMAQWQILSRFAAEREVRGRGMP